MLNKKYQTMCIVPLGKRRVKSIHTHTHIAHWSDTQKDMKTQQPWSPVRTGIDSWEGVVRDRREIFTDNSKTKLGKSTVFFPGDVLRSPAGSLSWTWPRPAQGPLTWGWMLAASSVSMSRT